MAKESKEKDIKLTEKEKKKIKENIMDEIKDDLTVELSQSLVDEVNKSFDKEYKDDLKSKITDEISEDIKKDIRQEEKKASRKKSFKIFRLYLYIVILLVLIFVMLYKIYDSDNMSILGLEKIKKIDIETTTEPTTQTTAVEEDLLEKYPNILDNLIVTDTSLFDGTTRAESMSMADRLSLAYNLLDDDAIDIEDSIYSLESSTLETAYNKLFGNLEYVGTSFTVNGIDYKYSSKKDNYIAIVTEDPTETNEVLLEANNITEDDDYIYVETIVAVHKGSYIYSKDNLNTSVEKYKEGMSLSKYKDKLTTITITFTKGDNNYLYSIN